MLSVLLGIIIAGTGVLIILKTESIIATFGAIAWAEEHLGSSGGTRLFYKLFGLILILLGFATITGIFQGLLLTFGSPLFSTLRQN